MPISCGVPQGSILGLLLFLVYVNDMCTSVNCMLSLYADDSALLFSHRDPDVIADRLSTELSNCMRWLVDNRLSLHVGKTECLIFGSKAKLKKVNSFSVLCDGTAVQRVHSVKYLGVLLDGSLCSSFHVSSLLKICNGRLPFLFRNSSLLDFDTRKLLCNSLIQPYLDYCSSSWYSCLNSSLRSRLDVLQRKMVRFIYGFSNRRHVGASELRSLSWLNISDRVSYFKLVHIFRIRHDLAPSYMTSNFQLVCSTHSYETRGSSTNYFISKSLATAPSSFAFTASKLWNSLPLRIKNIDSLPVFKRRLKEYLLSRYE